MISAEQRQHLRELALAATPGPWTARVLEDGSWRECQVLGPIADPALASVFSLGQVIASVCCEEELPDAAYIAALNPTTVLALLDELDRLERYEQAAQFLFNLLDDIDTASDMAKGDDAGYRRLVEKMQHRRFEVAGTDGYTVTFKALETQP